MSISLDIMLSKPGIYAISFPAGFGFVEVAEEGRCFQLTLKFERDDELPAGGWMPENIHAIYGPLERPGAAGKLRAILNAWNEFGPENGFGELMDRLQK